MSRYSILWADDEIDLLKPHILFIHDKGYDVTTVNNGRDAVEFVRRQHFDLIILDENMPGLSGLETLNAIKRIAPHIPVMLITKSEEEDIMNQAKDALPMTIAATLPRFRPRQMRVMRLMTGMSYTTGLYTGIGNLRQPIPIWRICYACSGVRPTWLSPAM